MAGLTEHRGLASVLPLEQIVASSGSQGGALVYWKLLQAPAHSVDQSQLKLYDAENGYPLKAALYEARLGLKSGEGKLSTSPPEKEPTVFTPGVSEKILTGLKEQAKVFKANDHIIYAEDFFDTATFAAIKAETQRLWRSEDIEANCNLDGTNRLGGYITDLLPHNSSLYHLIYGNDPFRHWVSAVNDEGPMWPSDFPIELREYGSQSKGMGCHPDLQMYKVPRKDLEFAFTVDNDSRCNVSFWDAAGKLHLVQTKPNSLMMVGLELSVNAATHCVSSTEGGTRSILKFIYVGDYRKSDEFWHYTSNECDDSNPNRQMLSDRRAQRQRVLGGRRWQAMGQEVSVPSEQDLEEGLKTVVLVHGLASCALREATEGSGFLCDYCKGSDSKERLLWVSISELAKRPHMMKRLGLSWELAVAKNGVKTMKTSCGYENVVVHPVPGLEGIRTLNPGTESTVTPVYLWHSLIEHLSEFNLLAPWR
eukprot:g31846.t3